MAKVIICAICGKKFATSRPHKKYCSFTCKEAGAILRRMKWEEKHPGYNKKYMKAYRMNQKEGRDTNEQ